MASCSVNLILAGSLLSVVLIVLQFVSESPPIPEYEEHWWGNGEKHQVDDSIRPFEIRISNEDLLDLQIRLNNTLPFEKPLEGAKQNYGMNTNLLQKVLDFWRSSYNWREREKFFNQYPQYLVNIQGLDIHYVHVIPKVPKGIKIIPLMLLHGWVGSIREFYELVPLLTTLQENRDFVFELIIPSLPGFGFSDATSKPGLGALHMAIIFRNLMLKIGYQKFYLHGTDWGGSIAQQMSVLFPQHIIGLHSTFCIVDTPLSQLKILFYSLYPSLFIDEEFVDLMYPLSKIWSFRILEGGYFHIQTTKPDTIGVALRESPVGLAAYLLEKFITLTNPDYKDLEDGGLTKKYTYTQLLDDIMVYWVTRSITSSMRIYAEQFTNGNTDLLKRFPIQVPTACARFKYDIIFFTENILKEKYPNLIQLTYYEAGHFPALEIPELLAEDIFMFTEKIEVKNK